MKRAAIVAMTRDRVIGVDGTIPWHHSADLKHFKTSTYGDAIIMGRITWLSLGGKPLPGRRNLVITHHSLDSVETFATITQALETCDDQNLWFIGGAGIYAEGLHYCDTIDVTLVPDQIDNTNAVRFPEIDPNVWLCAYSEPFTDAPELVHSIYKRKPLRPPK